MKIKKLLILFCLSSFVLPNFAYAENSKEQPPDISAESAIVINVDTNEVIYEKNSDAAFPIGSLTKIMDLYIANQKIEDGKIKLNEKAVISNKAWKTGGSRMFLEVGLFYKVSDLMKGIAILSGDDASVALAEHISDDTESFVKLMNDTAKNLKLKNTNFVTPTGLNSKNVSSASDLAILTSEYLSKYPNSVELHNEPTYTTKLKSGEITQNNSNSFLNSYPGAYGLKAGWENDNWNLVTTYKKDGLNLIAITLNSDSHNSRSSDMRKLLNYSISLYQTMQYGTTGDHVQRINVFKSDSHAKSDLALGEDSFVVVNVNDVDKLKIDYDIPPYLTGGSKKGEVVGHQVISLDGNILGKFEVITTEDLDTTGFKGKFFGNLGILFNWLLRFIGLV